MGKLLTAQELRSLLPLRFLKSKTDKRQNKDFVGALRLLVDDRIAPAADLLLQVRMQVALQQRQPHLSLLCGQHPLSLLSNRCRGLGSYHCKGLRMRSQGCQYSSAQLRIPCVWLLLHFAPTMYIRHVSKA